MKNRVTVLSKILLVLGMVQMLTGCLFLNGVNKIDEALPDSTYYEDKKEFFDEITASFQYKNLELTPDQQKSFRLPAQGLGFVSENFVYFIKDGQNLLELDQIFKTIPLKQSDNKGIINLEVTLPKTADEPIYFENIITLYTQQETDMSPDDVTKLVKAGFSSKNSRNTTGSYYKEIKISGLIFAKSKTDTQFDNLTPLTETRKAQFYSKKRRTSVVGMVGHTLLVPLILVAIPLDIVTFPIALPLALEFNIGGFPIR
jgi:hypothetical protein